MLSQAKITLAIGPHVRNKPTPPPTLREQVEPRMRVSRGLPPRKHPISSNNRVDRSSLRIL
jgi:hypothetical protein